MWAIFLYLIIRKPWALSPNPVVIPYLSVCCRVEPGLESHFRVLAVGSQFWKGLSSCHMAEDVYTCVLTLFRKAAMVSQHLLNTKESFSLGE